MMQAFFFNFLVSGEMSTVLFWHIGEGSCNDSFSGETETLVGNAHKQWLLNKLKEALLLVSYGMLKLDASLAPLISFRLKGKDIYIIMSIGWHCLFIQESFPLPMQISLFHFHFISLFKRLFIPVFGWSRDIDFFFQIFKNKFNVFLAWISCSVPSTNMIVYFYELPKPWKKKKKKSYQWYIEMILTMQNERRWKNSRVLTLQNLQDWRLCTK